MQDKQTFSAPATAGVPTIGKTAAKRRRQLELLEQRRRKTLAQLNLARAELAQAVAEAEARDRRRQRNRQLQDLKRLKFVLGGLVLSVIREAGGSEFAMTSGDLLRLTEKETELLKQVLTVLSASPDAGGLSAKAGAVAAREPRDTT